MKRVLSSAAIIVSIAVVAVIGSIAGRAIWDEVIAGDQPDARPPSREAIDEESAKEKFEGELLGVFVAPPGREVPDEFVSYRDVCGAGPTQEAPWERAGELDLSFELPQPFRLEADSLNTGVIACDETVYAARWEYSLVQSNGYRGSLVVARSPLQHVEFEASAERISAEEIGGRPAVYVRPLSDNGIGPAAGVAFPGNSVTTVISSSGVPVQDLLRAAEAIASALGEDG